MLKSFFKLFKPEEVNDLYFGKVTVDFDKESQTYYLTKEIKLGDESHPVDLYIESADKRSTKSQFELFQKIEGDFRIIKNNIFAFLFSRLEETSAESFNKRYRIESMTIPLFTEENLEWEVDFLNLEDGFSYLKVELQDLKPVHFSFDA